MSPLPVKMILKKEVLLNSVAEFLGVWAVSGEASLSLQNKEGVTTIAFSLSLSGHPEDPLHPPPVPTGTSLQRRRHRRGPARRERDRQRAARHQAAQASAPPASPPPAAFPAAPSSPEGLRDGASLSPPSGPAGPPKALTEAASTSPSLPSTPSPEPAGEPTPEKERGPVHIPDLVLSPIQGQRDDDMPSPTLFLCNQIVKRRGNVWYGKRGPKCEMTFNSESELRTHGHKDHYYCFQHETQYDIVCPAPGVPSHRCVSQMLTYCRCKCDCLCGTE